MNLIKFIILITLSVRKGLFKTMSQPQSNRELPNQYTDCHSCDSRWFTKDMEVVTVTLKCSCCKSLTCVKNANERV
jgi:hypothetical protein